MNDNNKLIRNSTAEFEKYRIVLDRLFESDFDKMLKYIKAGQEDNKND